MVRYIHPGTDALIKALSAAGVPLNLSAVTAGDSTNALETALFVKDSTSGIYQPVAGSLAQGGGEQMLTSVAGSRNLLLTQTLAGTNLAVQLFAGSLSLSAADNSTNLGNKVVVIPARANAAAPVWTEGNQVPLSTDLAGNQRTDPVDRAAREVGRARPWGNTNLYNDFNESTAPAANSILFSSGFAQAAGDYTIHANGWAADTNAVGKRLLLVHRNAANTADIRPLAGCAVPGQFDVHITRYTMALNEGFIFRNGAAGAASSVYGGSLQWRTAG